MSAKTLTHISWNVGKIEYLMQFSGSMKEKYWSERSDSNWDRRSL